jgi:GNAT superfamily N-acetyltransferase
VVSPPQQTGLRGVGAQVVTRPLVAAELPALADLFAGSWSTRHCRCTSFCSTRREFTLGWFGGGNERRFAAMAATGDSPIGVLAWRADQAVGWCACGPRSRYAVDTPRTRMIRDRVGDERGLVWFLPCFLVRADCRGQGITGVLARAAVQLARDAGAVAVEGWPVADSSDRPAAAFVGRESVLREMGFRPVAWPSTGRVIMRLDL